MRPAPWHGPCNAPAVSPARWIPAAALFGLTHAARAATAVTLDAVVSDDLRRIEGTITLTHDAPYALVDPLAALPDPDTDALAQVTFPGLPSHGDIARTPDGPDRWRFTATLPCRYGDIGAVPRHGLMANGGWYPQPIEAGGAPIIDWVVRVRLPDGAVGSVGEVAGAGTLRWEGRGERVSLAVMRDGTRTDIDAGGRHLDLLTARAPRAALVRGLRAELAAAEAGTRGVVVEAPLRRRLVQPGVRASYLSDRAWQLTPGLRRFHDVAVHRAVANALLDVPDPYLRDLAAASATARYARGAGGASAADALRWIAWVPLIDHMLHGQHTPFITEILEAPLPGDPLRDDLIEVLDPHRPGAAVLAQLTDRYGTDAADALGRALAGGVDLDEAAAAAGVDAGWVRALRPPPPPEDYVLAVDRAGRTVRVRRDAPADAAPEQVTVRIDGQDRGWRTGTGPDMLVLPTDAPPARVVVDPDAHLAQTSRAGDAFPTRVTPVVAAWFTAIDLRTLYLKGFAQLAVRPRDDMRALYRIRAYADEQTWIGGELGFDRLFGRELDGLRRANDVGVWVSPALLSSRYAPTAGATGVIGAGVDYTSDNRVAAYFPVRGHLLHLGLDAGYAPSLGEGWRAARGDALVYLSPHPRVAVPVEALAGAASGQVAHRLVDLGGLEGLRCLPTGQVVGTARAMVRTEARWAMVHNAALPLAVLWVTDLSVSGGVEAGVGRVGGRTVAAVGATAGVGWQVALMGLGPSYARVRLGYPLWLRGVQAGAPQVVLESESMF